MYMTYIINHTTYFFGFIGDKVQCIMPAPCWDYFFRACGVIRSEWAWAEITGSSPGALTGVQTIHLPPTARSDELQQQSAPGIPAVCFKSPSTARPHGPLWWTFATIGVRNPCRLFQKSISAGRHGRPSRPALTNFWNNRPLPTCSVPTCDRGLKD